LGRKPVGIAGRWRSKFEDQALPTGDFKSRLLGFSTKSQMPDDTPNLSVVLPCHNEQDNLRPLITALREAIEPLKISYEIVVTDDCSSDNSWAMLKEFAAADKRIRVQRFVKNAGQSAALCAR